jgi:hypothetical protein
MRDEVRAEIAAINGQIDHLEDPRACYARVQRRMRELRAAGRAIPEDLARLERHLVAECMAESQGR